MATSSFDAPLATDKSDINATSTSPSSSSTSPSSSSSTKTTRSTAGGVKERKLPSSGPSMLAINSEHKLRAENLPFDIDVWYPQLSSYTFPSLFIPLTRTEARAIMNYQETRFNARPKLTTDDVAILRELEVRLSTSLESPMFGGNGAFMRLAGRSPKDGEPLDRDIVRLQYATALTNILRDDGIDVTDNLVIDANTKLRAIGRVNYLRVTSGAEAMSLLLTSERVFTDMHDWLLYGEPEQVVLRTFEPELSLQYEFRAYVHNGRVNAISQYDHYTVYPELVGQRDMLQRAILAEQARCHHAVGVASYCMDFAWLPIQKRMAMIEISPFLTCTGAALFNWSRDRHLMENGPLEFRINTTHHAQLDQLVEANWEMRWAGTVARYDTFYEQAVAPSLADAAVTSSLQRASRPISVMTLLLKPEMLAIAAAVIGAVLASRYRLAVILLSVLILVTRSRRTRSITAAARAARPHLMMFYGTLKSGFHWNHKFLSRCQLVGSAITVDKMALVVGDSGVPYLLGDIHHGDNSHQYNDALQQIHGEVWRVDDVSLLGLDEYEGISKGYYSRRTIDVIIQPKGKSKAGAAPTVIRADVYVMNTSPLSLRSKKFINEYTLDIHRASYHAIQHIKVKQDGYLGHTVTS